MQIGAQLYIYQQRSNLEFGQPFEEALDAIFEQVSAAGYAGIEMPLALCGTPEGVQRIGELLNRHGLQLPSVYAARRVARRQRQRDHLGSAGAGGRGEAPGHALAHL